MATAPVKSQPLHNFPLSFLKWGNRCRRPSDHTSSAHEAVEDKEEERAWNLRPRKSAPKAEATPEGTVKSARIKGISEGNVAAEKNVLWIALSRNEIEEDVYAMMGGRPVRRAKKRPKFVQKQLEGVFPGLYLDGLTADAYRSHEATK